MELGTLVVFFIFLFVIVAVVRFLFKTLKWAVIVGLILVLLFVFYEDIPELSSLGDSEGVLEAENGSSEVVANQTPEMSQDSNGSLTIDSNKACGFDTDCMFIVSKGDCNLVESECNSIVVEENFVVNGGGCNKDSIISDAGVDCACIDGICS